MKKCIKCGIEKDRSGFNKESRRKDGLCNHCKDCEKQRYFQRKEKDPEGYRKIKREYARENSEKRHKRWKERYPL